MPNIYETGLSPLIELAKAALPGRRAVTAEDLARLLDPTTGAQRRVNVGGLNLQVHPEEWKYLQGPHIADILGADGRYTRDDVVDWLRNPIQPDLRRVPTTDWEPKGKGHESYTLPGPRANYRVRGLEGADGLTDSGDYSYHFADAPVHARLSQRGGAGTTQHLPGVLDEIGGDNVDDQMMNYLGALAQAAGHIGPRSGFRNVDHAFDELPNLDPNQIYRLARTWASDPRVPPHLAEALRNGLPRTVAGSGPRATHIDELQSDFYSMPRDERSAGPFEKLWPRLAFNQVANEALTKGDDLVTWSPPWVHDRLYRGSEPAVSQLGLGDDGIPYTIRVIVTPETLRHNPDIVNLYRGPQAQALRDWAKDPAGEFTLESGQRWYNPDSLMYHNVYGPNGVVEDAARRFARAYGEDPKALLTTTRLEGAGWNPVYSGMGALRVPGAEGPGADVPGLRISESMRDTFKRLRDELGAGVPLYAEGGAVQADKPITLEDLVLGVRGR